MVSSFALEGCGGRVNGTATLIVIFGWIILSLIQPFSSAQPGIFIKMSSHVYS
jgi:hypothetical protein